MPRSNRLPEIAAERGEPLESLIPRLYAHYGNDEGVAADLGVHPNSIIHWRRTNGYERKVTVQLVQEGMPNVAL